jgi:hypothetical protein
MSRDWGAEKVSQRESLRVLLWDMQWHDHRALRRVGGVRYSARLLELKRLGFLFEDTEHDDGGKSYRLLDRVPQLPQRKRVKVLLEEADVSALLEGEAVSAEARVALHTALSTFRANRNKL